MTSTVLHTNRTGIQNLTLAIFSRRDMPSIRPRGKPAVHPATVNTPATSAATTLPTRDVPSPQGMGTPSWSSSSSSNSGSSSTSSGRSKRRASRQELGSQWMEVIQPSLNALDADIRATLDSCGQKQASACSSSSSSSSSSNSSSSSSSSSGSSPSTSKTACPSLSHSRKASRDQEGSRRVSISNWLKVWGIEVNALCAEINKEAERAGSLRERMIREQALLVVASLERS